MNKKRFFRLAGSVTISAYTTVEAESYTEAVEIAEEREIMSIATTGGEVEYDFWIIDEADGEMFDIGED